MGKFDMPWIVQQKLTPENQEKLIKFLMTILADTKSIRVVCDCSHHDLYLELVDVMSNLGLVSVMEDWTVTRGDSWVVDLVFSSPLRDLLDCGTG